MLREAHLHGWIEPARSIRIISQSPASLLIRAMERGIPPMLESWAFTFHGYGRPQAQEFLGWIFQDRALPLCRMLRWMRSCSIRKPARYMQGPMREYLPLPLQIQRGHKLARPAIQALRVFCRILTLLRCRFLRAAESNGYALRHTAAESGSLLCLQGQISRSQCRPLRKVYFPARQRFSTEQSAHSTATTPKLL